MPRKEYIQNVRRVVVKIGSSLITENNAISTNKISRLVADIISLTRSGYQVVVVSSGAISAGSGAMNKKRQLCTIPEKQAMASVGQSILMNEYRKCFNWEGREVGQILLTEDDVKHRRRFLNARHTLQALLEMDIIPIVNENDSVVIKEIKFGDNDTLSAHVANIIEADLLILLSDVDGFYWDMKDSHPVEEIHEIDDEVKKRSRGTSSQYGTGGMTTKITAAEIILRSGEMMIIANGNEEKVLTRIMNGEKLGTLFAGSNPVLKSRKRWIAFNVRVKGSLTIDEGAAHALIHSKKSLLAIGIVSATGTFELGDAVDICDHEGTVIGRGIVNYNSSELRKIMGKNSNQINEILGAAFYDEVINRNDLIIF